MYEELEAKYPSTCHKLALFREYFNPALVGDLAEFGCFNGNGSRELASLDSSRTVYACDTFEGMPAEDYLEAEDRSDPPGKWKPDASPSELFRDIPNIVAVVGRFADTLPKLPSNLQFVLCHLDCDWYNSHRQALEFLETRLALGAVLVLDDPGIPGAKRAIAEWVSKWSLTYDGGHILRWKA